MMSPSHLNLCCSCWHHRGIVEQTEWATPRGSLCESDVARLSPAGSPGVLDFPEVRAMTCGQDGMVQTAGCRRAAQDSTAVALELGVGVHHHCHRAALQCRLQTALRFGDGVVTTDGHSRSSTTLAGSIPM